jgi:hypothetical protein
MWTNYIFKPDLVAIFVTVWNYKNSLRFPILNIQEDDGPNNMLSSIMGEWIWKHLLLVKCVEHGVIECCDTKNKCN